MKKKAKLYVSFVLLIAALLGISIFLLVSGRDREYWESKWSQTVTVENGVATPQKITQDFCIDNSGDHELYYSWLPSDVSKKDISKVSSGKLGFITAIILYDQNGAELFATTANAIYGDTTMYLEKGLYRLEFYYLTNIEQYEDFAGKYLCGSYELKTWTDNMRGDFASLQKNGTWTMNYVFEVSGSGSAEIAYATGSILGILVGVCLIVLFLILITKSHALESPRYDERQELERGRGFHYAFFTMLIFYIMLYILQASGLTRYVDYNLLYSLGLFLGIQVYVIYCIWHEAYFALNQRTTTVMISFLLIGLCNLAVTIVQYISGDLYSNGHFGPSILNGFCTLMFLSVFVTMFLKKLMADRANGKIEEEDEEDE